MNIIVVLLLLLLLLLLLDVQFMQQHGRKLHGVGIRRCLCSSITAAQLRAHAALQPHLKNNSTHSSYARTRLIRSLRRIAVLLAGLGLCPSRHAANTQTANDYAHSNDCVGR